MADGGGIGGKCTFGVRAPIEIHMLNEKIYREIKHFRTYKIYRPSFGSTPVTSKFYAAHDQLVEGSPEEKEKQNRYATNVALSRAKGPHSKYPRPVTESMRYGWYLRPVMIIDRNDRRFFFPKVESQHTKVEVIIAMCNPKKQKH